MPERTDLAGRTVLVAGAESALGAEASRQLVRRGATVVLGCARFEAASRLISELSEGWPHADIFYERLDLADLEGVRAVAGRMRGRYRNLRMVIGAPVVMVDRTVASQLVPLQAGLYAIAQLLLQDDPATLRRVVLATSLERRRGRPPDRATVRGAADRCARATALLERVLSDAAGSRAAVVGCRPSQVMPHDLRSWEAKREAAVVMHALNEAPRTGRLWRAVRWGSGVRRSRAFTDPRDAARLAAWLATETGISGVCGR